MKKTLISLFLPLIALSFLGCPKKDKSVSEKAGDAIEKAGENVKEGAEEVKDEIDDHTK